SDLFESALRRAPDKYYYERSEVDLFHLAAAYAFGFAKNHVFVDGNKRTGWASARTFLLANGFGLHFDTAEAVDLMVGLAQDVISEADCARWLRHRARAL
ncbi:MAG: type II toxin-antitoxin system death-on-curing family toxin, partial [Acetobacteraceae bacterium]|nr:type II toxin-antitoxin system death-on-curing family toxin [Acetobacteraceae bacterium]